MFPVGKNLAIFTVWKGTRYKISMLEEGVSEANGGREAIREGSSGAGRAVGRQPRILALTERWPAQKDFCRKTNTKI